jgi:hypothetical protein
MHAILTGLIVIKPIAVLSQSVIAELDGLVSPIGLGMMTAAEGVCYI